MRQVKITATEVAGYFDGDDLGGNLNEVLENILEDMKASPGGDNEELTLVIVNDLEPDDESEEQEKSSGT